MLGYIAYHTYDSRRSAEGFPDLVLVHPGIGDLPVIFAELKNQRRQLDDAQRVWLRALDDRATLARLWRPYDWIDGTVERVLKGDEDAYGAVPAAPADTPGMQPGRLIVPRGRGRR